MNPRITGLAVLSLLVFHAQVFASTLVWTNTAGGNWNVAANWSPNAVPAAADTAFITNAGTYTVTVNAAATIASLTVGDPTVGGSPTLAITAGAFTVTNLVVAPIAQVLVSGGTLRPAGPATLLGPIHQTSGVFQPLVPINLNTYNLTNGEFRGANVFVTNFVWVAGPLNSENASQNTFTVVSNLTIAGSGYKYFSSYTPPNARQLYNLGTATWAGTNIFGFHGGQFHNLGTLTINGDAGFVYGGVGNAPLFRNAGTLNVANSTFTLGASVIATNTGTLNLDAGSVLQANAATLHLDGTIIAADENSLRLNATTAVIATTNLFTPALWLQAGTLWQTTNMVVDTLNQQNGVFRPTLPVSWNNYHMTNGELRGADVVLTNLVWHGGSLNSENATDNAVTVVNSLTITGATAKALNSYVGGTGRQLYNLGTATWSGANVLAYNGALFQNEGTLTLLGDVAFPLTGGTGTPVFRNTGTLTKSAGTGTASFAGTVITNTGTFNWNVGSLSFNGLFAQVGGAAHLGTNFTAGGNVRIEAGSLTGRGTIAGSLYNNGVLNPGASPGFIQAASFTNTSAGVINLEIAATNAPGTNYDQLRFTGPATLNGTVNVTFDDNFGPAVGDRFTILTTSARSGTFSNVILPSWAFILTNYSTTNVVLEVIGLTNAPLVVLTNPASQTVWEGDPASLSVKVVGVNPISYQWQFNSTNLPGATNATYSIPAANVSQSGLYTVLINDGGGNSTNVSATLTVLPFLNTIYWTNLAGGNWSVAANWWPNRVPAATNNAAILSNGTYTVTVDVAAACNNLTVGSISGVGTQTVVLAGGQTLTVNGDGNWATNTVLNHSGTLRTSGGVNQMRGKWNWSAGSLLGAGRTILHSNATLTFSLSTAAKAIATNILENFGTINQVGDTFGSAQMPKFSGGAHLTNHPSGVLVLAANRLEYSASPGPRSYLINYGTVETLSGDVFDPSTIWIEFINYGLLDNHGYAYLGAGTNYGMFRWNSTANEISVFGRETPAEYFSFEDGTTFIGTNPVLRIGGYAQWNTATPHPGTVVVSMGSGTASFANPEFRILQGYTQTGTTLVQKGRWTQANPALVADLNILTDGLVNEAHTFTITNAGLLRVNTLQHNRRNLANGGSIHVRSNLVLAGDSVTSGGGAIYITNAAIASFTGGTVNNQFIENRGTNTVTGNLAFIGGAHYHNRAGARLNFSTANFNTGPASLLNEGLIDGGRGGFAALTSTNRGTVLSTFAGYDLALGNYRQESGLTELGVGGISGNLEILGGELRGTNQITGNVFNAAAFLPGNSFGLLSITGNHTNAASGTHYLPIQGVVPGTGFPQTRVTGTATLAGTLYVNFTNSFTPAPGNLFTAMTFTARSGVFDAVVNDTYGLEAFYTATNLVLRAENLLPSVNLTLPPTGTNLVCQPFRLEATASDADGVVTNLLLTFDGSPVASSGGAPLSVLVEKDFPSVNLVTATAIDDRGGARTVSQNLTLIPAPPEVLLLGGIRSNTTFKICMDGLPGTNYVMQANTNLLTTNWVNLGPMQHTNGIWRYFDTGVITNPPRRFYRAVRVP
ncbi:MAG: beta strand repeat-containing protein [Limisphaerales bacterium]